MANKINWCKILGHKWIPIFIIAFIDGVKLKFVACECKRCNLGDKDLQDFLDEIDDDKRNVCSYSEKYYHEK